jgi:flagellar motor switch protein FliG
MGIDIARERGSLNMSTDDISGPERIAAFLLSIDREHSLELLRHLDGELVAEVAAAMTELGEKFTDSEAVDNLYRSIAQDLNAPAKVVSPSDSQMRILLEEAFGGERADKVLEDIRERHLQERPFHEVERFSADILTTALRDETTTSVSIILSHIDPSLSADVLGNLQPDFALEVVTKMATLVPPGSAALASMARNLLKRLNEVDKQPAPPDPSQRLKTVAEMLNFAGKTLERSALESIEGADEEVAGEIREYMFTWTDLAEVDKRAMQKILGSVDTRTLALALKACPADVEENVANNLSSRVKAMVIEERELAGAVPMSEVIAARAEMLKEVHSLIDSGDFQPARSGEELVS